MLKNEVKTSLFKFFIITLVTLGFSSCMPKVGSTKNSRSASSIVSGSINVNLYEGRVLASNPIKLSKNANLSDQVDLNKFLSTAYITNETFLKGNSSCDGLDYCFEVRSTKESASPLQTETGKWSFNANTSDFLQVNTFYHLDKVTNMFLANLTESYDRAYINSTPQYDTSLPLNILTTDTSVFKLMSRPLIAFSDCNEPDNAYFERTSMTLCLGFLSEHKKVKWAQDSSVIYHEAGHFFQKLQLNLRNSVIGANADMGNFSFDEAGSIGEGLSDYYSYFVSGETHFSEWAAGRFLKSSRPITESDPIHVASISTDSDQRLSYPQYLNYNPNNSTVPVEDIHYSGMIISHYLVALTEDLQDKCLVTRVDAAKLVIHLISETLAELGDLSSNGTQSVTSKNKVNLNSSHSSDWFKTTNPINYRSFMQTFAKNLMHNLSNDYANQSLNRCNNGIYSRDEIESLIDQYGLLLFRTYNENRNLSGTNTTVNSINRKKSILVSKNLLILDPTPSASSAYIIDNRTQIKNTVTALQSGLIIGNLSAQTPSDFGFNNDNGKVSPGEVVAIALNLYNNSNTAMGGVQILANDWNHANLSGSPYKFPAIMSNDQWPLIAEGGVDFPCSTTPCTVASSTAIATTLTTDYAPVCFIQYNEASSTKWISQKAFKTKMALDDSFCLDPTKPNECFFRAIKGADQAYYSKINAKSTWGQTMAKPETGAAPGLSSGNILLFEVSKHIPPGTTVDCRLRVRFTNCEDCYHDTNRNNYDYTDADFNGPRPFKIIHLEIPIVD